MKKFCIALAILMAINISCKKEEIGGGLCACSPVSYPYLSLAIKNAKGEDVLNSKTNGYLTINQIQLYQEINGAFKNISFAIRPPFSYGSNQFTFYQLYSSQIVALTTPATNTFYLKLGESIPYKLTLQLNSTTKQIEKLVVNDKEAVTETGSIKNYTDGNIFYLHL